MTTVEIATFFGLPVVCLALLALRVAVSGYEALTSPPWHSACGVIEESSIQIDHDSQSDVVLRFKFSIDHQPYWGNQVIRVGRAYGREQLDVEYPVGKQVSIIYHPNDPEFQSMLDPNKNTP